MLPRLDNKPFDAAFYAEFGGFHGESRSAFVAEAGEARHGGRVPATGMQRSLGATRTELAVASPCRTAA